ncbi:MAG: TerC/Alx family metal homeostasis membrane protein [Thermoleophilaceae bacterium]
MVLEEIAPIAGLVVALVFFLALDLHYFARGREADFREAAIWSIGWLVLSLAVGVLVLALDNSTSAIEYTTVYLIERSLSLDNLFVFIILFTYFGVPEERRARLLFWGIVAALALRAVFILVGVELIEQFHFVIYVLGVALLFLAYRIFRGVSENVDPEKNLMVRLVRRIYPVTDDFREGHWLTMENGKRYVTPLFLCLVAIVFADIAFAIDSIPAAFAITDDAFIIWMGNVFALLGLRALFVLVEGLIARFRYLDETIAVVLAVVGVKLLVEDLVKVGPLASLAIIAFCFAVGIAASLFADSRDPEAAKKREERRKEKESGGDDDTSGDGGSGSASAAGESPDEGREPAGAPKGSG